MCVDAADLVIEDNSIEGLTARLGLAISATRLLASHISGNRIGGALAGIYLNNGG